MVFSFDSTVYEAFSYGIISACSLPLGCLTVLLWKPSGRAIAFLMAFGGGALLAALTIDLVANTLAKGDFYPLAIGCILGGLIFIALNQIVNNFGGFIRKSSTHFYHIQKIKHRRFKDILSAIKLVDVFKNLQDEEVKTLTEKVYHWDVKQDTLIFSQGEPCDELYFIVSGRVELLDPEEQSATLFLEKNDDLGWLAFITGTPYRFVARATTNTQLWVLPRAEFMNLLVTSPQLIAKIQLWFKSAKVKDYLQQQHHLSEIEIDNWCQSSSQQLIQHSAYSSAILIEHNKSGFKKIVEGISSFNLFNNLPEHELETISNHLEPLAKLLASQSHNG